MSALMELCTRRHLGSPNFVLVGENGPAHYKQFLYKVNSQIPHRYQGLAKTRTASYRYLDIFTWNLSPIALQFMRIIILHFMPIKVPCAPDLLDNFSLVVGYC